MDLPRIFTRPRYLPPFTERCLAPFPRPSPALPRMCRGRRCPYLATFCRTVAPVSPSLLDIFVYLPSPGCSPLACPILLFFYTFCTHACTHSVPHTHTTYPTTHLPTHTPPPPTHCMACVCHFLDVQRYTPANHHCSCTVPATLLYMPFIYLAATFAFAALHPCCMPALVIP